MSSLRGWPPSMVRIAELVGKEAALALVENFGGTACMIPKTVGPDSQLARAIGAEAAAVLSRELGTGTFEVPTMFAMRSKKARIAAALGTNDEVARRFKVSSRWVREIRRQSRKVTEKTEEQPS